MQCASTRWCVSSLRLNLAISSILVKTEKYIQAAICYNEVVILRGICTAPCGGLVLVHSGKANLFLREAERMWECEGGQARECEIGRSKCVHCGTFSNTSWDCLWDCVWDCLPACRVIVFSDQFQSWVEGWAWVEGLSSKFIQMLLHCWRKQPKTWHSSFDW